MSEFVGMRRIQISLEQQTSSLPEELEIFTLYPTETAGVYDTPYTPLGSPEWTDFERVLTLLEHRGTCHGWKVLNVY